MSLPAAMSPQAVTSIMTVSPLDTFLQIFNTNPYFIGIMMLILNLGGRFISLEVTKKQEQFLQHPWVRRILIFTVLFVATRNIWVAFWTTVSVVLFLGYLFNENSSLCIFGSGGMAGSACADQPQPGEEMTPEEKEILHRLSAKAQRYQQQGDGKKNAGKNPQQQALEQSTGATLSSEDDDDVLHTDVYAANLTLLRN
jgi:hypothetical protein